jgi:hypothetical protein
LSVLKPPRPRLYEALKECGRRSGGGPQPRNQGLLLICEVALGVVLLMQKVDLGFNPANVLRADVFLDGPKFWHNTPGRSLGAMKTMTPQGDILNCYFCLDGRRVGGLNCKFIAEFAMWGSVPLDCGRRPRRRLFLLCCESRTRGSGADEASAPPRVMVLGQFELAPT